MTEAKKKPRVMYLLLSVAALILMFSGLWVAYAPILRGIEALPHYVNLRWAHESSLLETLLSMLGMLWLAASAIFWGGWLLRRSVRKMKGQHWRVNVNEASKQGLKHGLRKRFKGGVKSNIVGFFPPVLPYLKVSSYYLMLVLLFVILQYPLQFLFFQ